MQGSSKDNTKHIDERWQVGIAGPHTAEQGSTKRNVIIQRTSLFTNVTLNSVFVCASIILSDRKLF